MYRWSTDFYLKDKNYINAKNSSLKYVFIVFFETNQMVKYLICLNVKNPKMSPILCKNDILYYWIGDALQWWKKLFLPRKDNLFWIKANILYLLNAFFVPLDLFSIVYFSNELCPKNFLTFFVWKGTLRHTAQPLEKHIRIDFFS